jgi:hypothetical protein
LLGLGLGLGVELALGVGVGLVPVGLLLGVGLVLAAGLLDGVGLVLAGALVPADGLLLGDGLALGLAVAASPAKVRTVASSRPDRASVLLVSAGRTPQGDLALGGGTSRVPARATPNMLPQRMEVPANVLSATAPACHLLTGTTAPQRTALRGLLCSPWLLHYARSSEDSPPCLFDT